jgi:alpha-glucosidase
MLRFLTRSSLLAVLLLPFLLRADDERRVVSPNGEVEFRIFSGQPAGALWGRIGYQIFVHGKPLLTTSWLGLDIQNAEPFLGENPGFMESKSASTPLYNSLVAIYMQNGSLGRRLDIEARAYNDGVAFRYVVPKSTALEDFLLRDEATEFNFADPSVLKHLPAQPDFDVPFLIEQPGAGWVAITAVVPDSSPIHYPVTYLDRTATGMITNLARSKNEPILAFDAKTPITWLWRVVLVGPNKTSLTESPTLKSLMLSESRPGHPL